MAPAASKSKSKRKAKGVGVDFKKVKHKVGRKLAPPQNATKVEFKSKDIVLPAQSMLKDKEGQAVNQRYKTLKELFSQIPHYSERVRKDALIGIRDLFLRNPEELEANTFTTIQKLASRFTDVDKAVRHALLVALRSLFPSISKIMMKPLVPFVMAHLGSAMTNLSIHVRVSAFSFLDLLLLHYPALLVPSATVQIMEHYDHFFQSADESRSLDSATTLKVLNSLSRFLSVLLQSSTSKASNGPSTHRWSQKHGVDASLTGTDEELTALHGYKNLVAEYEENSGSLDGQGTWRKWLSIVSPLIEALLNCWAQNAPAVCSSPMPDAISLECLVSITKCFCLVFEWLETFSSVYEVRLELRNRFMSSCSARLMASFPLSAPSVRTVPKIEEMLAAFNAGICETMLHFLVPISLEGDDIILQYYESALSGELLPASTFSSNVNHRKLAEPFVKSLMEFFPWVYECSGEVWRSRFLQVLTDVFEKRGSRSSVTFSCLPAISKILLSDAYPPISEHFTKKWLQSFPRLLWELKDIQPSASKTILETMLHIGKSAVVGSTLESEFEMLQASMIPFFCTILPTKEGKEKILYGPFLKLPRDCQEAAVYTIFYFRKFQPPFLKAIASCCISLDIDAQIFIRLLEVIEASCVQGFVAVDHFLSFLLTLLVGSSSNDDCIWTKRHSVTVAAVSRSLSRLGDNELLLSILVNPVSEHLNDRCSPCSLASFLRIIVSLSQDVRKHENLKLPTSLLRVLSTQAAACMISRFLAKDHPLASSILRNSIVLLFRSKKFGKSLMKNLTQHLSDGRNEAIAVGVLTTEICKQEGISRQLEITDVNEISSAVKEILKQEPGMKQLFNLETSVRAAFGSEQAIKP